MSLHKQQPTPSDVRAWEHADPHDRWQTPDIFEVVEVEESAVPQLEIFQKWLHQQAREHDGGEEGEETGGVDIGTIVDLYRDEYAWLCGINSPATGNGAWNGPLTMSPHGPVSDQVRRHDRDRGGDVEAVLIGDRKARWNLSP